MVSGVLSLMIPLCLNSSFALESKRTNLSSVFRVRCSNSGTDLSARTENLPNDVSLTGGAYDFGRATKTLTQKSISAPKTVTLVRHGLSSWNDEGRVQGSSNLSVLTETRVRQAERCRKALQNINFNRCFSSPISRAKNIEAVDARQKYPKEYTTWREEPSNFQMNGVYPIRELWGTAREAWRQILLTPGENFLVVSHKSILRALICTALGLGPERSERQ